jgi:hypothetical protein
MSSWLIATIGVVYLFVAADLFLQGKGWLALMFLGYSVAQVGVWGAAKA